MEINLSKIVKYPQGNGLSTTCDLNEGDVILQINKPYVLIVENESLSKICASCCNNKPNLKRCTGCKVPYYCSTACQKEAWDSGHKGECAIFKNLPGILPTETRALVNLILRKELNPVRWTSLEDHSSAIQKSDRWEAIVMQARAAIEYTKSPQSYIAPAVGLLCKMSTHAFRASLQDGQNMGLCFEPEAAAMANHSCTPNSTVIFDGRRMALVALKTIQKEKQIYISYIDTTESKASRQKELKERYFFDCRCDACS